MKDFDILSPISAVSGVISLIPLDIVINGYALFITIICGSVSVFRITLHVIRAIRKFKHGKLTLDEAISEFDKMEDKNNDT